MPHLNLRDISHSEITASGLKTFQSQVNNKTWLTAMSKYSRVRFQDKLQLLQSHHAVFYSLRLHSFCHLISSDRLETIVQTAAVFWRRRCLAESLALQAWQLARLLLSVALNGCQNRRERSFILQTQWEGAYAQVSA